jgi:AcrR family transcriptional regulator
MARPPRSSEEVARIRAQIVEAAERVLARRGVNDASIDEIGAEAGFSPASIYTYFEGREELLGEVVERTMERVMGCIVAPRPRSLGLAAWLECVAIDMLRLAADNRAVMELLFSRRLVVEDDAFKARLRESHQRACGAMAEVLQAHTAPELDPDWLAFAFLGLVRVEIVRQLTHPEVVPALPARAEALVHLFLHGALAGSSHVR